MLIRSLATFAVFVIAGILLVDAAWQGGTSFAFHRLPACGSSGDTSATYECTTTAAARIVSIAPDDFYLGATDIGVQGIHLSGTAVLPAFSDTSPFQVGDQVQAEQWGSRVIALSDGGHTLYAMGHPDAGPLPWYGSLILGLGFLGLGYLAYRWARPRSSRQIEDAAHFWLTEKARRR